MCENIGIRPLGEYLQVKGKSHSKKIKTKKNRINSFQKGLPTHLSLVIVSKSNIHICLVMWRNHLDRDSDFTAVILVRE